MRKRITNEKGEVMIESLIVYLVTFTLLFLILALLMVSYQRFTVKSVATEGGGDLRIAPASMDLDNSLLHKFLPKGMACALA